MTAASMTDDPQEENEIVDDLFGEAPEEHPDDLPGADEGDPKPDEKEGDTDPVAAKEENEPDPEPDAEEDDEDDEPGNLRLPEKEEAKADDEPTGDEPELSEDAKRLAAEERRSAGLQKELKRLRAERLQVDAQSAQRQQAPPPPPQIPQPAPQAAQPVPDADGRIPVVVAEDGQSVYVDEEKLAERMQAMAQNTVVEAMKPTPEQESAERERQLAQSFVGQDRERNEPIYMAARDAENFIYEAVTTESQKQGLAFNSPEQVQEFIRVSGIGEKVAEFFPTVAPLMDEFVAAGMADNPTWKRSVLDRMGPREAAQDPIADVGGTSRQVESIDGAPRALSRKGAGRSVSPNSDESEFNSLEKRFREDPIFFSDKDEKRMISLGKKLGVTGME